MFCAYCCHPLCHSYAGYVALRGVAEFPKGLPAGLSKDTIRQMWGTGVRAGTYPVSDTQVYWFTCANAPAEEGQGEGEGGPELRSCTCRHCCLSFIKLVVCDRVSESHCKTGPFFRGLHVAVSGRRQCFVHTVYDSRGLQL